MTKTTLLLPDVLKAEIEAISQLEERRARRRPRSIGMVTDGSLDPADDEQYLAERWKLD